MACSDKLEQKQKTVFFKLLHRRNSHLKHHYPLFSSHSFASGTAQFTSTDSVHWRCAALEPVVQKAWLDF